MYKYVSHVRRWWALRPEPTTRRMYAESCLVASIILTAAPIWLCVPVRCSKAIALSLSRYALFVFCLCSTLPGLQRVIAIVLLPIPVSQQYTEETVSSMCSSSACSPCLWGARADVGEPEACTRPQYASEGGAQGPLWVNSGLVPHPWSYASVLCTLCSESHVPFSSTHAAVSVRRLSMLDIAILHPWLCPGFHRFAFVALQLADVASLEQLVVVSFSIRGCVDAVQSPCGQRWPPASPPWLCSLPLWPAGGPLVIAAPLVAVFSFAPPRGQH